MIIPSYFHQIKVTDGGNPPRSDTCRVSVMVVPTPKKSLHPPVIKATPATEITERDEVGYLVALIQATDGDNDTLWYDIVGELIIKVLLLGSGFLGADHGEMLKLTLRGYRLGA